MSKLLEIIDAVNECEKHQCSTIAVSTCEKCPSFEGIYVERADHTFANMENALATGGKKQVKCIYPKERYKCDSLCIHYINKECPENDTEMCIYPSKYKEIGDVADALNDAEMERRMG
jgi:hypothetical protein